MKEIKIDGVKPVKHIKRIENIRKMKVFALLSNDNGATSVLVVFMMIVLVTLGAFAITSARANISFATKASDWDQTYYLLDGLAEEFARDVDNQLIMAEDKTIEYIQNKEYELEKHSDIPIEMQTKFNKNILLIASGETIPDEVPTGSFGIDLDIAFEDIFVFVDGETTTDDEMIFVDSDDEMIFIDSDDEMIFVDSDDEMIFIDSDDEMIFVDSDDEILVQQNGSNEIVFVEVEQDGEIVIVEETTGEVPTSTNNGIIVITIEDDGIDNSQTSNSFTELLDLEETEELAEEQTPEERDAEIQTLIANLLNENTQDEEIFSLDETVNEISIDNEYQDEFTRYLNVMANEIYLYYADLYLFKLKDTHPEIETNMLSIPQISYSIKYSEDETIGFFIELEIQDILCKFDNTNEISEISEGARYAIHTWREWQNVEPPANGQSIWDGSFDAGASENPFGNTGVDIFGN